MAQHAGLTLERWRQFSLDQQVLMIGNEMHRASKMFAAADRERLASCYERVLALVDLTVEAQSKRTFRRELLRWREVVAGLYLEEPGNPTGHRAALRCLLFFTPEAAKQVPLVAPLGVLG